MLQSSQIEKPRCSATIDQMRLRPAMCLAVESQNSLFFWVPVRNPASVPAHQQHAPLRSRLESRCLAFPASFERSCHEPVLGLHSHTDASCINDYGCLFSSYDSRGNSMGGTHRLSSCG